MYICICNAIREQDFRAAAHRQPNCGAEDIYLAMGRPPQCGHCLEQAEAILTSEREARKLPVFCPE